jgi:protein involved in polysaccharide export with SLBB domain
MNLKYLVMALIAAFSALLPADAQIRAGRAVQITISGVPATERSKVDGMYPVSEAGTVNMPLIGPVRAAGLQSHQLALSIQSRYQEAGIYTNPTIQVISSEEENVSRDMVHIGGQVRRPGPVPYVRGLTLYQAIQAGGGATEFGNMKRVKLFRGGNQKQYDLTQAQDMRIPLEPNDTIEVPQKTIFNR